MNEVNLNGEVREEVIKKAKKIVIKSRKVLRAQKKKATGYYIGKVGKSPFANINLRQTRRNRSRRLKVEFQPRFNGPVLTHTEAVEKGLIKPMKFNKYAKLA